MANDGPVTGDDIDADDDVDGNFETEADEDDTGEPDENDLDEIESLMGEPIGEINPTEVDTDDDANTPTRSTNGTSGNDSENETDDRDDDSMEGSMGTKADVPENSDDLGSDKEDLSGSEEAGESLPADPSEIHEYDPDNWAYPVGQAPNRLQGWIARERGDDHHTPLSKIHPDLRGITIGRSDDEDDVPSWGDARKWYAYALDASTRPEELQGKSVTYYKQKARQKVVERLMEDYHVAAEMHDEDGDQRGLYVFNPDTGLYEEGYTALQQEIECQLAEYTTTREQNEILSKVYNRSVIPDEAWDGGEDDPRLIPAANGVINLDAYLDGADFDEHFRQYQPTDYFTWQLDAPHYQYVDVEDTRVHDFLEEIQPNDTQRATMLGFAGHALKQEYEPQGFLIMCGSGSDGKTTFSELVTAMFGGEDTQNVSAETLDDLTEQRFAGGQLAESQVNIAPDLSAMKITNGLGELKSLTGGDPVSVERKNEQKETVKAAATMIFGANTPPIFESTKDAIARRLYFSEMNSDFVKDDEDREVPDDDPTVHEYDADIVEKITQPHELAAFLRMAMNELREVERTDEFAQGREMSDQERLTAYEALSDTRKRMAREILTEEPGAMILKDHLMSVESNYSQAHDATPVTTKQKLTRILQNKTELDVESRRSQAFSDGSDKETIYEHIAFTDAAREYMPPRMESEYFEDVEEDMDEDGIIPLSKAARDPSGYVEVSGRVISISDLNSDESTGLRIRLTDSTGTMDVISWDNPEINNAIVNLQKDAKNEACIRIKRAQVKEKYDNENAHEIKIVDGTEVYEASPGVGYIPTADSGHDGNLLGEAASTANPDDTSVDDVEDDVTVNDQELCEQALFDTIEEENKDADDYVEMDIVIDRVVEEYDELERDKVEQAVEKLKRKGKLYVPKSGTIATI